MTSTWVNDALRGTSAALDRGVYTLVTIFYQLFMDLARIQIFSVDTINKFTSKIYVLLGLFMLLKVSFSFINYIVNPDMLFDKTKGAQKILINVIISLAMLTLAPFAFSMLSKTQTAILEDNIIPAFFLGDISDNGTDYSFYISNACASTGTPSTAKSEGDYLAILSFRPFYQPDYDLIYENYNDNDVSDATISPDTYCGQYDNMTVSAYLNNSIYNYAGESGGFMSKFGWGDATYYTIDYKIFLSTVSGIVIVLLLLSFCFDVAVRAIKLGFLEIIAPIPILSYIDPKSGKDGMFSKWLKEVGSTWLDLFIRLSAVYFAVYVISLIGSNEIDYGDVQGSTSKIWLMLFIIIGALMFAKKLPSLIEKITGFKFSGSIQLNPFKKISSEALGGKSILGAAGALGAGALGLGMGAAAHLAAISDQRKGFAKKQGKIDAIKAKELGVQQQLAAKQFQQQKMQERKYNLTQKMLFENDPKKLAKLKQDFTKVNDALAKGPIKGEISDLQAQVGKIKSQRTEMESQLAEEKNKSKLYKHPMRGTISEATTSAYNAMKKGYSKPEAIFKNAFSGNKAGINRRNYYEDFNFSDKMRDKWTDFAGIRNDSGTTSEVKSAIKTQNDILARTEQYIKMLNENLTAVAGKNFSQAVNYNTTNNKFELNTSYRGADAKEIGSIIEQYNEQIDKKFAVEREINRLSKQQDRGKSVLGGSKDK